MGFLRDLFGPSHREVWSQLASQLDAQFHDGGWFGSHAVQAHVKDWIITLDTYTVSTGKSSITYTRMRAPFVNQDGFRFHIFRTGFFSELGKKWFHTMDLEMGDPDFDRDFIVRIPEDTSENRRAIQTLLADSNTRALYRGQPSLSLTVVDNEPWPNPQFPAGVDSLQFVVVGVIKDPARLKGLFDLFADQLNRLCHAGSAYEDSVELLLQELAAPGGRIERGGRLLWDGDTPRRRAAESLGRKGEARAVAPLMEVLADDDLILREKAIAALGEIGDCSAVPALIPFLGESNGIHRLAAASALRKLGEEELVKAFGDALWGFPDSVPVLKNDARRRPIIAGLIRALEGEGIMVARAAQALASLGAVEALPALERRERRLRFDDEALQSQWTAAVEQLRDFAALPRAASVVPVETDTLPRPADDDAPITDTLPKSVATDNDSTNR